MKLILPVVFALLLAGCVTVKTSVTSFHTDEVNAWGKTIKVVHADEAQANSLAFRTYKANFEEELAKDGFVPTENDDAELIAVVSYGIDDGTTTTQTGSSPVYGQTGGGYTTHSGTISSYGTSGSDFGMYSGSSYTYPTYGIVGSETYTYDKTVYKRFVAMNIYNRGDFPAGSATPIYEGYATSSGSCGNMSIVLPIIVQSMFEAFPGENGKTQFIKKPLDVRC